MLAVLLAVRGLRRWSRADRSVAPRLAADRDVKRGDLVRDASAQGRIVAALHPTLFAPRSGIVALAVKAGRT